MSVFPASQDRLVTGVTAATVVLMLGMAAGFVGLLVTGERPVWQRALFAGIALLCLGVLGGSWAWHPRGYALTGDALVVLRPVSDLAVPYATIQAVRTDPTPFAGAIRVAGNGGLFGFWGRFRSRRMDGSFTAWATRRDRGVVVDTTERRIVVTPDEPDRLVADLTRRLAPGASVGGT